MRIELESFVLDRSTCSMGYTMFQVQRTNFKTIFEIIRRVRFFRGKPNKLGSRSSDSWLAKKKPLKDFSD